MTNLVTDVAETVAAEPGSPAIVSDDATLSYGAFWERAGRFGKALRDRGLTDGDRVGIYLPNLPQFVTAFYGTLRAGGVVVPMNPQYKPREISHLLADSDAKAVVSLSENVPDVREVLDATDVETVVRVGESPAGTTGASAASAEQDAESVGVGFEAFLAEDAVGTVARADDDVAVQPYTSGTTGTPKGVLLTHRNIAWTTRANADVPPGGLQPSDRLIGVLPLFHIYGMSVVMNGAMFSGGTYYPVAGWDAPAVMDRIEADSITVMFGVPAMFNDIVNQPDAESYEFGSLRFANSGGASLPLDVLERFEALYDVELYEGYGLTETSPVTHANRADARRKGSIGPPIDGVDAMVVDEAFDPVPRVEAGPVDEETTDLDAITGEIVVSGPNVMRGYDGRPEANEAAFSEADGATWFHTGDIGYWDEDGFFYVVDRKKHVIVTGGYNVYPREIEELLFERDDVADAAVVGVPDERRGETVAAFVVPTPEADATPEEIKAYCLSELAAYKHPRDVTFVDELPRTTTGKVRKFELASADGEG